MATKVVGLRAKTYRYLIDDGSEDKKAKDAKRCVIKRKLKFKTYKNCFEATQHENKIKHLEKKIELAQVLLKHSKDIKVKGIIFLLKKLIRLL